MLSCPHVRYRINSAPDGKFPAAPVSARQFHSDSRFCEEILQQGGNITAFWTMRCGFEPILCELYSFRLTMSCLNVRKKELNTNCVLTDKEIMSFNKNEKKKHAYSKKMFHSYYFPSKKKLIFVVVYVCCAIKPINHSLLIKSGLQFDALQNLCFR